MIHILDETARRPSVARLNADVRVTLEEGTRVRTARTPDIPPTPSTEPQLVSLVIATEYV